jgi:hypothetical protein
VSWIGLGTEASGIGSGSVTFLMSPNTTRMVRTGTLMIAGQSVSVTESR